MFGKALREPMLHFMLIGISVFMVFRIMNGPPLDEPKRIVVTTAQVELLAENFSRTWMRQPGDEEIHGIIEDYLRDEVLYREAVALGLDKGDSVIQRRLRLKLEFILADVAALVEPTDAELTGFMQQYADSYRLMPDSGWFA